MIYSASNLVFLQNPNIFENITTEKNECIFAVYVENLTNIIYV